MLGYVLFDQDISYSKPYFHSGTTLAKYYGYCRDQILNKAIFYYFTWFVFAFWTCFVTYYIPQVTYSHSAANSEGLMDGMWKAAFSSVSVVIYVHAILIALQIRNWTWVMAVF
jgi:hypothetical protein